MTEEAGHSGLTPEAGCPSGMSHSKRDDWKLCSDSHGFHQSMLGMVPLGVLRVVGDC